MSSTKIIHWLEKLYLINLFCVKKYCLLTAENEEKNTDVTSSHVFSPNPYE